MPPVEANSSREISLRSLRVLGAFATLIFFFSPAWSAFHLWYRVPALTEMIEVRRGASVLTQVAHPGAAISDPLHAAIRWRILFPVAGRTT